MYSLHAV